VQSAVQRCPFPHPCKWLLQLGEAIVKPARGRGVLEVNYTTQIFAFYSYTYSSMISTPWKMFIQYKRE
jgi:hypothetical protein